MKKLLIACVLCLIAVSAGSDTLTLPGKSSAFKVKNCTACNSSTDGIIYTNPNTDDSGGLRSQWQAHPFTFAATKCVTGVTAKIYDDGTSVNVTCEIYTNNAGVPGSIVGAGYTATVTNIPDTAEVVEFLFAATQTLPAGDYWVVAKPSANMYFRRDDSGAPVPAKYSNNSGASWTDETHGVIFNVLGCD